MPCCAFAVFLVLQLLAPFTVLRSRLSGERGNRNPAAAWRYGAPALAHTAPAAVSRPLGWRGKTVLIVAAEALVLAVGLWIFRPELGEPAPTEDWDALVALHTAWCGPEDHPTFHLSLKEPRQ